eukprot:TRINITY_DN125564_c0_g1_i1.p1 TRINITY_DN125564_c0_g1~~TRINITY_DN125564_c0_g1_i1.p1  ORF type:complete len:350 (+),score=68.99 TRINITY_DN125564_c0_g1_i1:62-1111(+)
MASGAQIFPSRQQTPVRLQRRQGGHLKRWRTVAAAAGCVAFAASCFVSSGRPRLSASGERWRLGSAASQFSRIAMAAASGSEEEAAGDDTSVEVFRQSLIQGWGKDVGSSQSMDEHWAEEVDTNEGTKNLRAGDLLIANPDGFIGEGDGPGPARIGMNEKLPSDYMSKRELYRRLPVVLLTKVEEDGSAEGLVLSIRTGRLMGDLVQHFMSRPLYYGGPDKASLTMIHPYPEVPGSRQLGDSGLYESGDFAGAQEFTDEGTGSSLRFRFFVQKVEWGFGQLSGELQSKPLISADLPPAAASWIPVRASREVVLTEADSLEDKPLWLRVAELAGDTGTNAGKALRKVEEM